MRRLLVALALLALVVPVAAAQELINPIQGSYGSIYLIVGRIVDKDGVPLVRGSVVASLDMPGAKAPELTIATDCYGTFYGYYTLHAVSAAGTLTVTYDGPGGKVSQAKALDPFFRRSNFLLQSPGAFPASPCSQANSPNYTTRISVSGRILERVATYPDSSGTQLDATPKNEYVHLAVVTPDGKRYCPPSDKGANLCEPIASDERGDFRYSWTFSGNFTPAGHVEIVAGNRTFNETIDPLYRMAWADEEVSGQGAPIPEKPAPLPPTLALASLALVALGARRLLPRNPR